MAVMIKGTVTTILWLTYLAMLYFAMQSIGAWVIGLGFVLFIPLVVAMVFMWAPPEMFTGSSSESKAEQLSDSEREKRKRDRLDAVLRDLSDEQLYALKQRLSEPGVEDRIGYMLGDDGELIEHPRKR